MDEETYRRFMERLTALMKDFGITEIQCCDYKGNIGLYGENNHIILEFSHIWSTGTIDHN